MRTLASLLLLVAAVSGGCETENATHAIVANAYPPAADGGIELDDSVVYRAWWTTVLFAEPIVAGARSETERAVKGSDYAYAILARGWDPESGTTPEHLLALRSKEKLSVKRGATLTIRVSDETFDGDCAHGAALDQDDADFITARIFPGNFAGSSYDAATCTLTKRATDPAMDDLDSSAD
jgi:hypothetical protein